MAVTRGGAARPLGWIGIVRLGLVQSAIGAIVMLATSLLNRVMVIEYALPAALPAGLVAWHYAVQLSRPAWGHGSDRGRRRTPWIVGGMALLAGGAVLAVVALPLIAPRPVAGYALEIAAFGALGAGVGAAGTSLLALLAARVAPARRGPAASITWIMMIVGIVASAGIAGRLIDPFSLARLTRVVVAIAAGAFVLASVAVAGLERGAVASPAREDAVPLRAALAEIWADRDARRFTQFVFVSMLAYSMQDLILEPFAGLRFGFTPGQSTSLSGTQHGGVLVGMVLVGLLGARLGRGPAAARRWIVGGCLASALALLGLAAAARVGPGWPLSANIAALGFANGMFAVAAVGAMMTLASAGGEARTGLRMGVWGAAQAIAFGAGGLTGAVAVDALRAATGSVPASFLAVFGGEALLFVGAALLALGAAAPRRAAGPREALA